ncbi:uncharacterized protein LOC104884190 [Beta vulgaris subsp. vulgaris]|uniref:uncharacterized protein LOC104884190 n=1 Tax=Beta vulgaris subsp. vulgaris TaxID=3555 RepID=UPI00053F92D3|nr:uncharacterized protein LOC104884190 [Beta vulgaris subsp. vulgaris]
MFSGWCFTTNSSYHAGGRIIIAWKAGSFHINIISAFSQYIHCFVQPISGRAGFFCTFIYAFNESKSREILWEDLRKLYTQEAWIICGDLNCVLNPEERIGSLVRENEIRDIRVCMNACELTDIKSVGNMFTWNNKQEGSRRVYSKLGRVMANSRWQDIYSSAEVCFQNEGEFDHSPALITVYPRDNTRVKPFRYFTMLKSSPQFMDIVKKGWSTTVQGTKMYVVLQKLKAVKKGLKELDRTGFAEIQVAEVAAYNKMMVAQNLMHQHPGYTRWVDDAKEVTEALLTYYKDLLGTSEIRSSVSPLVMKCGPVLTDAHKCLLEAPYTVEEIKHALLSIPGSKAPGPDGFSSSFDRDSWDIVGEEVVMVVLDILQSGKLLKELNTTTITLIPKVKCPKSVKEFRPISCCNTIYKCVTKVLCGRLRQILPNIIMENQGGFVHGRYIAHNIMVVRDLVKNYGRKKASPSCILKIDIQKVYDTMNWEFLKEMITRLQFPVGFIQLVMECYYASLYLLLGAFKLFSNTSGLKANVQKSAMYTCGMKEQDVQRIIDASGFERSTLPFKYLGVPICSKKISTAQCEVLTDKITARIRMSSTRHLSYMARCQLINSVLLSYMYTGHKCFFFHKEHSRMLLKLVELSSGVGSISVVNLGQ